MVTCHRLSGVSGNETKQRRRFITTPGTGSKTYSRVVTDSQGSPITDTDGSVVTYPPGPTDTDGSPVTDTSGSIVT